MHLKISPPSSFQTLLTMLKVNRLALLCVFIYVNVDCAPLAESIVYPKLLEARGINGKKVLHIKDGLTLSLEKLSVLADSLVFTESSDGVSTKEIINGTELQQNLYQDRDKMAAVAVEEMDDTIKVTGVLSEKLRIAPLPLMARSEEGHFAHKIYEVKPRMNYKENDNDTLPENRARTERETCAQACMKRIPDQFLVEVHMMVDEPHYKVFDQRKDIVTYLALTIALVNMRYEDTSGPNIQFLLTSIQKEQNFARTFVEFDIGWPEANRTYADASTTYKHLLKTYGRSPADITVAVTGFILADAYEEFSFDDTRVQGQARLGGVCNASYSMVMVEDVPMSFGMVTQLPHELGHALGAPHDGLTRQWNECLPPRNECRKDKPDGHFIMHPFEPGNRKFSNCSREHMIAFISTLSASCFELKAKQNCTTEMKELPGVSINLTKICEIAHPNFREWNIEMQLDGDCRFDCCSPVSDDSEEYPTCIDHPLPEGADCGGRKRCVRGACGYYDEYGNPTTPRPGA